jgi:hypothetical protein
MFYSGSEFGFGRFQKSERASEGKQHSGKTFQSVSGQSF